MRNKTIISFCKRMDKKQIYVFPQDTISKLRSLSFCTRHTLSMHVVSNQNCQKLDQ
mgnify:CR=1 FL=1